MEEFNLVEMWLRHDPLRWVAGALGGLFAGAVSMLFAMAFLHAGGMEIWFPAKLMGTLVLGPFATEYGMHLKAIGTGFATYELITMVFGMIFSHFVGSNRLKALFWMGVVWGIFSWIFLWNLFGQSFHTVGRNYFPSLPVLPICLVYGISLVSVAFFDRIVHGIFRQTA